MDVAIECVSETQIITRQVEERDADAISCAENILTILVPERTRGVTKCAQNIIAEALRIKMMK